MSERYELSLSGVRMLTGFEAMVLHEYRDVANVATVCVGHVIRPEDEVWLRDGVTREECDGVLQRDTGRFADHLAKVATVKLSQPIVDATISLMFNIGEGAFDSSTVLRRLNAGDYTGAADAFTMWRFANVKQKDGTYQRRPILLGRRESEAALFRSGILEATMGARRDRPSLESLLARAQAAEFNLQSIIPTGHEGDGAPSNDDLTPDGRMVALPPSKPEDEAA